MGSQCGLSRGAEEGAPPGPDLIDQQQRREAVTGPQLREAERAFRAMLRAKGFPAAWIDRNLLDLLAQASGEYASWLGDHEPEENPVGWLVTCAYRRAVRHEQGPTPEGELLGDERQRRLRRAIGRLGAKDGRLISLVYFEGRSVREAGRRLGWHNSAAEHRHQASLERLRALVGDDLSLLSPAPLGLAAWASAEAHGSGWIRLLAEDMRRLVSLAEPSGAPASGRAGRIAGACGAGLAAALCGLAVSGVGPPPPWRGESGPPGRERAAAPAHGADRDPVVIASPHGARAQAARRASAGRKPPGTRRPRHRPAPHPLVERTPPVPPVAEEPGIEGGSAEAGGPPAPPPSTEPPATVETAPAPTPARPASGAQVGEEFGL